MHMKAVLVQYKSNYSKKCPYFIQIKSVIGNDAFFSFYFYQWNVLQFCNEAKDRDYRVSSNRELDDLNQRGRTAELAAQCGRNERATSLARTPQHEPLSTDPLRSIDGPILVLRRRMAIEIRYDQLNRKRTLTVWLV